MTEPDPGPATAWTISPRRRERPQNQPDDMPDSILDETSEFLLYVADHVVNGMRLFAAGDPEHEVGGVLLGRRFRHGSRSAVFVEEHLPLPSASRSAVHFTFDEEALRTLHQHLAVAADRYVVGWFHSHPRMGDPFMSTADVDLHETHFREPWHVSCVVASGVWSLPLGFWRIADRALTRIEDYYVRFTPTLSVGGQSRRFLEACVTEARPLGRLVARAVELVDEQGMPGGRRLATVLRSLAKGRAERPAAVGGLEPVAAMLEIAREVAVDAGLADDVEGVATYLKRVRFLEESTVPAITTPSLTPLGTIAGDRYVGFTPGQADLSFFDLVHNKYWRVTLDSAPQLRDADCSSPSSLWLLGSPNVLVWLPTGAVHPVPVSTGPFHLPSGVVRLSGLSTPVTELTVSDPHVWVRTEDHLIKLAAAADAGVSELGVEPVAALRLPDRNCCLVRGGEPGGPLLLSLAEGQLCLWDDALEMIGCLPFWSTAPGWRVLQACAGPGLLYVLLERPRGRDLWALHPRTLQPRAHFVQDAPAEHRAPLLSLARDDRRRVFVRLGEYLYLLAGTGSLSRDWFYYHLRSLSVAHSVGTELLP